MWRNYLNITVRNLKRHPLFSFINISGLSIGLALCMLIVLYLKDEKSFDKFHSKKERIYRIVRDDIQPDGTATHDGNTGMRQAPSFKDAIPEIESFVRVQSERIAVKVGNEIFEQEGLYADSNFFSVFDFPVTSGNPATALKEENAVVLSEEVAVKFFGSKDVLNKTIELPLGKDKVFIPFKVTAVVPHSPLNSSIDITMLLPMELNMAQRMGGPSDNSWMNFYLNSFVVLDKNADPKKVESKMAKVYTESAREEIKEMREKYDFKGEMKYFLQSLKDMHLSTKYTSGNGLKESSKPVYGNILSGIALFILLIACINFINLTLARSLKRAKEIGIRKVVGGERSQIIIQFLGETFLLCLIAFLLALAIVIIVLPVFNALSGKFLSFSYLFDLKLLAIYTGLFLLTSLMAGFYPAFVLSGFDPVKTLYNRVRFAGKNYLGHSLVILQFAIAAFLIISTITVYRQFSHLTGMDLGYNDKDLVMLRTDRMKPGKLQSFKSELLKDPSIKEVAARQGGNWYTVAKVDGKSMDFALEILDTDRFDLLVIPIVQGRNLSPSFPSDSTSSVLVNEEFVRKAGWKDLKNRKVDFFYDSLKYDVVGVVKNHHFESLAEKIGPQLFIMHPKYDYGELMIRIGHGQNQRAIDHIRKVTKAMFPLMPFNYSYKDVTNRQQYEVEEKFQKIILYSAIMAIFISCIGLFGLANLAAEKRTKEIGIRKVLGDTVIGISSRLSIRFLQLVMIAVVIAIPAAWYAMNLWLENYPFRIEIGVWVFVITVFTLVLIALLTTGYQSLKAARANPVKSLRSE
jgi:ABC-type antimicrobial peptide transport system permease subunit/DNA-binding Lrp family transcriptional regulator